MLFMLNTYIIFYLYLIVVVIYLSSPTSRRSNKHVLYIYLLYDSSVKKYMILLVKDTIRDITTIP